MTSDTDALERTAWLTLLRAPGLGAGAVRTLVAECGGARAAIAAARGGAIDGLATKTRRALLAPDRDRLDRDARWLDGPNRALLVAGAERAGALPAMLDAVPEAPAALFVDGELDALWLPQLAIVGSRNASPTGLSIARDFAATLAGAGFTIVSGLASGIDAAAHEAALDAGGRTIAVCATGLDQVYPERHAALAERIRRQGALVSEFPLGTPPRAHQFPRRNRIIAGLALGTLVVEASLRSGSLITARLAAECGREVYAVPGSIHNPLARGCHRLIRDGAKLVETAADVIEELRPQLAQLALDFAPVVRAPGSASPGWGSQRDDDPDYRRLFGALAHDPLPIDELVRRTGFPASTVSSMLLLLELDGAIEAVAGGRYQRSAMASRT